jgi:hypothetical protein
MNSGILIKNFHLILSSACSSMEILISIILQLSIFSHQVMNVDLTGCGESIYVLIRHSMGVVDLDMILSLW